jgi:hypothetical protein
MEKMRQLGVCFVFVLIGACGGIVEERSPEPTPPSTETRRACAAPTSSAMLGTGASAVASPSGCTIAIVSSDERSLRIHDPTGKTQGTFAEDGRITFLEKTTFASGRLLYLVARDASSADLVARDDEGLGARHVLAQKIGNASVSSDRASFATAWSNGGVISIPLTDTRGEPIRLSSPASSKAYIAWVGEDAAVVAEPGECAAECSSPETRYFRYATDCGTLRFVSLDGTRNVEIASAARLLSVHAGTGRIAFERTLPDGRRASEIAFPREGGRAAIELRRFAPDTTNASGERVCDGASVTFAPDGQGVVIDADHVVVPNGGSSGSCSGPLRRVNPEGRKVTLSRLDGAEQTIAVAPDALVLGVHSRGVMVRRDDVVSFVAWDGGTQAMVVARTAAPSDTARDRYLVQTPDSSSTAIMLDARDTPTARLITKNGHVLSAWNDDGAPRWFFTTEMGPLCDGSVPDWHALKPSVIDLAAGSERAVEHWPLAMAGREGVLYRVHPWNDEGFVLGPIPR